MASPHRQSGSPVLRSDADQSSRLMSHRPELLFNTSTPQKTSKHPSIHETIRASSYQPSQSSINTSAPQPPLTGVALLFHCSTQETPTPPPSFPLEVLDISGTARRREGGRSHRARPAAMVFRPESAERGRGKKGAASLLAGGEDTILRSAVLKIFRFGPTALPSKCECVPEVASSVRNV